MKAALLVLVALVAPAAAAPFEVHVDPRVELVWTVFRLAGAEEYLGGTTPYQRSIEARFAPWKDHPVVAATRALRANHGVSYDAPMQLALYLDPKTLQPLRPLSPPPPGMDGRWKGAPIDDYLEKLRDFEKVSGFRAFFAEQAPYYGRVEASYRALAAKLDLGVWIEAAYGKRAGARAVIVPGVQSAGHNFGITVALPDGSEVLTQILFLENADAAGLPRLSVTTLALWAHEASHPYVNPLVAAHAAALADPGAKLYALVGDRMKKQAYAEPQTMLAESIVRAQVIGYLGDKLGPSAARHEAREQLARGFFWSEELAARLGELRRTRHLTLAQAMPEVITFLVATADRATREGLPRSPFRGPIDGVFAGGTLAYAASPGVLEYVAQMKVRFKQEAAPLVAADKATWATLPGSPILYGAPGTHPLVAELLAAHGEKVGADGITVAGKTFEGKDLVLIVAYPRPDDAMRGVLVYTAASDATLVGVNALYHGPGDWVVGHKLPDGTWGAVGRGDF